ncbi:tRNA (adenosine(37)-N6)-dimethylallyltransferase MiaA [Paramagnetospirillum marisnigri]|uniref:tRNA dimethylallyltransferase n=1 Tax=Paramagnetospirillum marisnigri TaxID=1285242 RepID=A0A178MNX5_9PROT|nr:tRNA (adenosine(37)-N6)-dimethylallyltransferase MiaA [Paramagnetospirillum marisnigri]OAN49795.1 tRNA (adenosine(37)-N6)-dimethylallyltransferase MiaA [Paramagnetospirillum marisnigri]
MTPPPPAIVVAGPTASGKSGLALRLAREFDGVVINADSMQVYAGLPILTAQPPAADHAVVPHRLYGVLPPSEACSAARWRDLAAEEMNVAWEAGKLPIVVGGTGLYLRSLMQGLSPIPDIPDEVRDATRARMAEVGAPAFHAELAARDPVMAERLRPSDSQRLVRAAEVLAATGRSLAQWQAEPLSGGVTARWFTIALLPEREPLYAACDRRFRAMVAQGALDEARAMADLGLDPALPAMKALGLRELMAHLAGEMELDAAIAAACQATRNYAKRQVTWFRHQLMASETVSEQLSESLIATIFLKIRQTHLTPR